jgi:hypothetical protein
MCLQYFVFICGQFVFFIQSNRLCFTLNTTAAIVRFEVVMAVRMMMPFFSPEDGDSVFLQNVGIYQLVYMVSKPTRTASSGATITIFYILMFAF